MPTFFLREVFVWAVLPNICYFFHQIVNRPRIDLAASARPGPTSPPLSHGHCPIGLEHAMTTTRACPSSAWSPHARSPARCLYGVRTPICVVMLPDLQHQCQWANSPTFPHMMQNESPRPSTADSGDSVARQMLAPAIRLSSIPCRPERPVRTRPSHFFQGRNLRRTLACATRGLHR